jgi:hypothetical protein
MFSRGNIAKYSVVSIVFVAGVFFTFSGYATSIARRVSTSADAVSQIVNAPDTTDVTVNLPDTDSAAINISTLKSEVQATTMGIELNNYVLKAITAYQGGKYPYLLNDDYENYNGVTENISYQGSIIAKANPDGSKSSHCVGLTYEVFYKAMKERNREVGISSDNFNNMTIDNMKDFLLTWYAAKGNPKSEGNQLAGAIVKYGLGTQITRLEDAKAGDFIDFSRTKSGHTGVFINRLKDDKGNIVGFKYWSTQESTNGIGYKEEYFSDNLKGAFKGAVDRKQIYIGRVGAISNYRSF